MQYIVSDPYLYKTTKHMTVSEPRVPSRKMIYEWNIDHCNEEKCLQVAIAGA